MIYSANVGEKDSPRDDVLTFTGEGQFTENVMEAKKYKVLSHKYVDDEYSIWIDGNVFLNHDEQWYYDLLGDYDIAVLEHPLHGYPGCIYKEAKLCQTIGKGDADKIQEQIEKYQAEGYPANNGMGQCCMIIRRHTPELCELNEAWWAEITRYSTRDQLSFPYIFGDKVKYLQHDRNQHPAVAHNDNEYFKRYDHNYE